MKYKIITDYKVIIEDEDKIVIDAQSYHQSTN
jgi:hypothetical protein